MGAERRRNNATIGRHTELRRGAPDKIYEFHKGAEAALSGVGEAGNRHALGRTATPGAAASRCPMRSLPVKEEIHTFVFPVGFPSNSMRTFIIEFEFNYCYFHHYY